MENKEKDKYIESINFYLPGAFAFTGIYETLLEEYSESPFKFKDNAKIGAVYGSPGGIWNGGRTFINVETPFEVLENIKGLYEHFKVPVRFTFTNNLIQSYHVHDEYCNGLLNIYGNGNHEILCNSEILERYIRNGYGNKFKYISSTTKRLNDPIEQTKEMEKDYSIVVIDYDFNKDFTFLEKLPHKEKCELLCNAVCKPHCVDRLEHYRQLSKSQLSHQAPTFTCENCALQFWQVKDKNPNFISKDDINNIYIPMGFRHYKLEGRTTNPLDLIEILLYYLVKDEYKDELRNILGLKIW